MNLGRLRLGMLLFAPLAAAATLLLVLLPARLDSAAMAGARQRAVAVTEVLARAAAAAVDFDDAEHAHEVLGIVEDDPEVLRVGLRGADERLLAWLPAGQREAALALPFGGGPTRASVGRGVLTVVAPVVGRSGSTGSLVMVVNLAAVEAQRRQNTILAIVVAGVVLVIGLTFSGLASIFLLRRRRAEEARARSERNLSAVIEASPDGMIVHRGGRIAYVNGAAHRILGAGELQAILPAVPQLDDAPSEAVLQGGVNVELRSLSIAFDDAPATLVIARDVTQMRRMQAQLVFADRMASVGTLAAGVAHEINNPLAFVVANIAFAEESLRLLPPTGEVHEILGALADAAQGGDRVSRIVKDLKTFARADQDERAPVDLQAALDLSLQMTSSALRHCARVEKRYGPVPRVDGSASRLGQVFVNLLVNAAHALPEDGHQHLLEVATRTDAAGRAVVAIRDSGKGMTPEVLARIFDPFFTTKPIGVGTGLGLSICHNIVSGLGGDIAVHSKVGEGTTFTISLPPSASEVVAARELAAASAAGRRGRVLVIDDEPLVARALRRTLAKDTTVEAETSAADALARFRKGERFDAVLCDLMMPEMTGMDLYDELLRVAPDQRERIIFVTGAVFPGRAREFLDSVARPHVEKPFDPRVLRDLVKSVVEQAGRA